MTPTALAAAVAALALAFAASPTRTVERPLARAAAQTTDPLRSSDWLAALPDGEEKRRFILDCTGCHQLDDRVAFNQGAPRTEVHWDSAVVRMLRYAGATTGFPVISAAREPRATARWLAEHLRVRPPARALPAADAAYVVREYTLPVPMDLPHDVAITSAGRVIVTGMFTHQMYDVEPASGEVALVPIPIDRANPRAVDIDSAGNWWVVLGGPQRIARYDPAARAWSSWHVAMYPHSLAIDSTGKVWFNGHFTRAPELIGYVTPGSERVDSIVVPSHPELGAVPGGPIPYEIRAGRDGTIWGSELGGNRVFSYSPAARQFEMVTLPTPHSGPRRLDVDRAGHVWIPAYAGNELLRYDPRRKSFDRFPLPTHDALPYVARVDDARGAVWIGTGAADAVFRFDIAARTFRTIPLPSRGALVRHMSIDPRNGDVWLAYGASPGPLSSRIARVSRR